jgi:hypothetical protein
MLAPPETPAESGSRASEQQPGEFGELEADPNAERDPSDSASSGYGTLAPLPTYVEALPEDQAGPPPVVVEQPRRKPKPEVGFIVPEDFGPFYEAEPVSEVHFPGDAHRPDREHPFASVAGGTFCFVEDSACAASLIADADVGVGLNVITSSRGFDVPYTQFRVRGGFTVRPVVLAKKRWHKWGVGVVGSWSLASGSINQLWLSQKRNALHVDFTLGAANSSVLDFSGRYWGTQAELGLGFGGWGGLYLAGDFFDGDTRVFIGMRGHAIATGPMIALIVLGLVAGGVAL